MKLAVRIFAILLLAAAVAMVFFYKGGKPEADDTPPPVRPVKSMLVGPPPRVPSIHFPGVVDARAGVDLSFEVGGRIVEFPATRGQEVKEGDGLARLDDRDYANSVKTAEAELAYAESNFKRMEAALAKNAVSQDEFSSARASRDKARAALDSARKALDDTVLMARFSGVVSDTYADNFDTVSAGTPILKLQDLSAFDLAVSVPESYVLSASADVRSRYTFTASFDSYTDFSEYIEIFGEKGSIRVPDPNTFGGPVRLLLPGQGYEEIPLDRGFTQNSRALGLSDMADAMANGRLHRANSMQQLHVLDIMTAFARSSKANAPVEITSPFERQPPVDPDRICGKY